MSSRTPIVVLITALVAGGAVAPPVAAHGGVYIAPAGALSGSVPPALRSSSPGTAASRTGAGVTADVDRWEFWWEYNKDRWLDVGAHVVAHRSVTGTPGQSGHTAEPTRGLGAKPSPWTVASRVLPALVALAAESDEGDVLDSVTLALARSADGASCPMVRDVARESAAALRLSSARGSAQRGSLSECRNIYRRNDTQTAGSVPLLTDLARGGVAGAERLGGRNPSMRLRWSATLALGLTGAPEAVALLSALLRDGAGEVRLCAAAALGLAPPERAQEAVAALAEVLSGPADVNLRSHTALALGKLDDPIGLVPLLAAFTRESTPVLVRQSCAVALGRLARVTDAPVVEALRTAAREDRDAPTRHFALMALGRIGSRDDAATDGAAAEATRAGLLELLLGQAVEPENQGARPWAALAAGLVARGRPSTRPTVAAALAEEYVVQRDPSVRAAFGPGPGAGRRPGPGRAPAPRPALHLRPGPEVVPSPGAGPAAAPPGRRRPARAVGALRRVARLPLARGPRAGVHGRRRGGRAAAHGVGPGAHASDAHHVARAMGLIGDRRFVEPLLELIEAERVPASTRALAVVALGMVAERTRLPWNQPFREDGNHHVPSMALGEVIHLL